VQDTYYSRQAPIRGLSARPACGLTVGAGKDAASRVRVPVSRLQPVDLDPAGPVVFQPLDPGP
jgi:hypothetical protein